MNPRSRPASELNPARFATQSGPSFAGWQAQGTARNLNPPRFPVQTLVPALKRRDAARRASWIPVETSGVREAITVWAKQRRLVVDLRSLSSAPSTVLCRLRKGKFVVVGASPFVNFRDHAARNKWLSEREPRKPVVGLAMRRVLGALATGEQFSVSVLAEKVHGAPVTPTRRSSMSRVVSRLESLGLAMVRVEFTATWPSRRVVHVALAVPAAVPPPE